MLDILAKFFEQYSNYYHMSIDDKISLLQVESESLIKEAFNNKDNASMIFKCRSIFKEEIEDLKILKCKTCGCEIV